LVHNERQAVLPNVTQRLSADQYRALMAAPTRPSTARKAYGRGHGDLLAASSTNRPRKNDEEQLQRACFEWILLMQEQHPILRRLFHPASGGARSRGEAGKLKAMGVRKGPPDFLLPLPGPGGAGLAVELKAGSGRATAEQLEWMADFAQAGYVCGFARTLDEFVGLVMAYVHGTEANFCTKQDSQ
jgi:hypothetical protein